LAFTVEHAARVTNVSERRIRYWDTTGVLSPSLAHGATRAPYSRIYSFRDLVGLRTLGQLRDRYGLTLQRLRAVGERLTRHHDAPWSTLRFFVEGNRLYFRDPESSLVLSTIRPGQATFERGFDLVEIARQTEEAANRLSDRQPDDFGRIVQHRHVLGNRPTLAGTRVPTAAVWDFHRAGYNAERIIQEYPRLNRLDIDRAIAFETDRRASQQQKRSA